MESQHERDLEQKEKFFDRHAAGWDKEQGEKDEGLRALAKDMGLNPGDKVIEPGCGTGLFSAILLENLGEQGRLYGVDISKEMLAQAQSKGFGPRASFDHADASRLPFPENFADAVVCFRAFPHYNDKAGALSEFSRVLKEGGLLVIAHPAGREKINAIHARAGGEVADDRLPDKGDMRKLLDTAGFDLISLEDRNDRYLLRAGKSSGPAASK